MVRYGCALALLVTVVWNLSACTPTLNWREVRLDALVAMLPCKPDRGTRSVQLAGHDLSMNMAGCEAGGALFAVSHVRVSDAAAINPTAAAWRVSALANMHANAVQDKVELPSFHGAVPRTVVRAQGARPDANPVQAQLVWFTVGPDIYHAAVYANHLSADMTDPFFSDLRVR